MDLMPENPIQTEQKKSKISIPLILVLVLIVILIIAAIFIWFSIQKLQTSLLKVSINGVLNTMASNDKDLFLIQDNGKVYTSINKICEYLKEDHYIYMLGGYRPYSDNKTECYVNNNKEIVTFTNGSNEIIKYPR